MGNLRSRDLFLVSGKTKRSTSEGGSEGCLVDKRKKHLGSKLWGMKL